MSLSAEVRNQHALRLFEAISATTPDFFYVFDLQGRFVYANRSLLEVWGVTEEEALGKQLHELGYPAWHVEMHMRELRQVIETRKPIKGVVPFTGGSGIAGVYEYIFSPVLGRDGEVEFIAGTTRDVSDRKRAEDALRDLNAQLEERVHQRTAQLAEVNSKFQAMYDQGVFAGLLDCDGLVVDVNRSSVEQCGFTREQMLGKPFWECGWWNPSPALQEWIKEGVRTCVRGLPFRGESPYFVADGSQRIVEFAMMPIKDESGRVLYLLPTGIDVTDRRRAADAQLAVDIAKESETKFRHLAETIPQLAWMARPDGHLFWYNRRWYDYTGSTPEAMEGWGWKSVHDPAELPRVIAGWEKSLATGEPFEMEFPLRASDGRYRWFLTRVAPLRDDSGRIQLWFGTNTDIEDRRIAAEERTHLLEGERAARADAERASRMKDEFLATLSHELRTPLNAILGWAQILKTASEPEDIREGVEIIERNARAQTQIIEDLLDMSRIISGKIKLDVQRLDLATVVRAAVETVQPTANAKGVRIQMVLGTLAGPISGDPSRLQQVFWNLLSNAVKFTPRGGRVQVVLERVNSHVEVNVIDTGEGIDPKFLPHVFDRFRQADATTTRRHGGLGLGLALVKQLVEVHGGSVRVKSPGVGMGSTFSVLLPLTVLHPGPSDKHEPHRRHPSSGPAPYLDDSCASLKDVRVLVVDDEPDARALVKRLLEDCEAVVITASSAREALERVAADRPDVMVSDIGMPGEDGYSLMRQVRALPAEMGGKTPAVALTAYARPEDRMRAVLAGFEMHVVKPVEPAELITMVASLAARSKA